MPNSRCHLIDDNFTTTPWLARAQHLRDAHPLRHPPRATAPLHPVNLCRFLAETLPPDAIIATDVGQHQMWTAQAWPFRAPRTLLTSSGLGTMGFGLPAAIGAALAVTSQPASSQQDSSTPKVSSQAFRTSGLQNFRTFSPRRVACISGDGSLLMNLQELATLADLRLPVAVLVFNNAQLGLVRQQQELFYGGRYEASIFETTPDYAALARAFGIRGHRIAPDSADPLSEIAAALAHSGPCLIDIPINAAENVLPMVPPGAANRQTIETA